MLTSSRKQDVPILKDIRIKYPEFFEIEDQVHPAKAGHFVWHEIIIDHLEKEFK